MTQHLLVSTDWLADHLGDPNLRIVDIRGHVLPASEPPPHYFNHRADYHEAHIPGAVFVDWVHEITDPDDPRHAQIAKPARYIDLMCRLGVDENTLVVAYDDALGMFAARLWWSLNYYGHHNVAVLDGGWDKWVAEGRPTTADVPQIERSQFSGEPNPSIYCDGNTVLVKLDTPAKLLDLRSAAEFAGESSRASRKGRIPGAINCPRGGLVAEDGTLKSADALRAHFAALGLDDPNAEVITYCNAGVSASFGLLALRVAGYHNSAMYDGSWKDWGNDPDRPIEVGG